MIGALERVKHQSWRADERAHGAPSLTRHPASTVTRSIVVQECACTSAAFGPPARVSQRSRIGRTQGRRSHGTAADTECCADRRRRHGLGRPRLLRRDGDPDAGDGPHRTRGRAGDRLPRRLGAVHPEPLRAAHRPLRLALAAQERRPLRPLPAPYRGGPRHPPPPLPGRRLRDGRLRQVAPRPRLALCRRAALERL